jgi:acetoin utilization deacetylase AcuC-like enzyme
MIMNGQCTNVFCPTRPPGHHAGRELHAMKAVSNGFCVLNPVACAALYATTPISNGGLGLSRVCVIDIDVHHGNGTQDILCSTYDPRFLYVSIHAGGAGVNGVDLGEIGEQVGHHLGRNPKKGIFPGRCGDTCPHKGVLNIPLGGRVTSHALGTALMTKVSPAVDNFAPELIIVSAGFDAHKNDPLNLGGLAAEDFGTLTEIICKIALKSCSGRVLSVLEGGYGVPCCRPQQPPTLSDETTDTSSGAKNSQPVGDKSAEITNESSKIEQTKESFETKNENGKDTENTGDLVDKSGEPKQMDRSEEGKTEETADPKQQEAENGTPSSIPTPTSAPAPKSEAEPFVPLACLDLGEDLPPDMADVISSYALQKKLDKCHAEGFLHSVREHVSALARCNSPK